MFAIVVKNEVLRRCETMEQALNHVEAIVEQLAKIPSNNPWGHNVDVFVRIAGYTTRSPESWPKEKP